jgi:hypothetical protein
MHPQQICPDCDGFESTEFSRRDFVKVVGAAAAAASMTGAAAAGETQPQPETLVKKLYDSLTPQQKEEICFAWDYADDRTGNKSPLRLHVSNNWNITDKSLNVGGKFFTKDQQELIEALFFGMYNPEWHDRIRKQLQDDAGGYGKQQTIALFGEPGTGKFEFVMTGRHLTIRCDGDSTEHTAFGGPIFYGHAAQGFNEKADHPGNVFWHQALEANKLYQMLDGKQRERALVAQAPPEREVHFRGKEGKFPGIPVANLAKDQQAHVQKVLETLVEPYRTRDKDEALKALKVQGGLEACSIAFFQSGDIGDDKVWDIWRLEGPSFVWHFRGSPHVHVWVNIADDPSVQITTQG